MSNKFFSYWFKGFEKALDKLDDNSLEIILRECGSACSESYTKNIYISEYKLSENLDDFLERLSKKFPEMQINKVNEKLIEIIYIFCACDLVKDKYISDSRLCRCSLYSLQKNWDAVMGKGTAKVTMKSSILAGDKICKFRIEII